MKQGWVIRYNTTIMALSSTHNDIAFGVGDTVRVHQLIQEGEKSRLQVFEGMVIRIKGREVGKTFTVRRIGVNQIGIEKIFPVAAPIISKIEVVKKGMRGVKRAKLYYTREKSNREISKIYSRAHVREESKKETQKPTSQKSKKVTKTTKKASSKKAANATKE